MKRIFAKVHHFTQLELTIERIAIILLICLFAAFAFAASVVLPIRATIVQCGPRAELERKCREDARCCALLEASMPDGGALEEAEGDIPADDSPVSED